MCLQQAFKRYAAPAQRNVLSELLISQTEQESWSVAVRPAGRGVQ